LESILKYLKVVIGALACFITVGCGISNSIPQAYKFTGQEQKGVLMGSVSYSGMLSSYAVNYRNTVTGKGGSVNAGSSTIFYKPNKSKKLPYATGKVFALGLAPGRYIFDGWNICSSMCFGEQDVFSIEVQVEEGKAIYLGNFHFKQTKKTALVVTGADVYFQNRFDKDVKVLNRAYPNIRVVNSESESDISFSATLAQNNQLRSGNLAGRYVIR